MAELVIEPMVAGQTVVSADRSLLTDVFGKNLADVGVVPRLGAQAAMNRLRLAADGRRPASEIFLRAARMFASDELAGETAKQYVHHVVRGTGLTAATIWRSMTDIVAEIEALPATTAAELPAAVAERGHSTRWVPAGGVFGAVMASNHPLPHSTWVQALFVGYSVVVRPGKRDPFTPRRLAAALIAAGLPVDKLAFLPCAHGIGSFLLHTVDRGIIYGSDAAVREWRDCRRIASRGPGRSRALLDVALSAPILDHLAVSAAYDGGARCTNLSAVLTSGPVREVADQLAARLTRLPALPATDPAATLLVLSRERADALRRQIAKLATELTDHTTHLYGDDFIVDLGDGSFLPRPMVFSAAHSDHPAIGMELAFPFVVVAPWSGSDGLTPLSPALVLNLHTNDDEIQERALGEPGIRKVTRGAVLPWELVPGIPHDGNYTQFLLEAKSVVLEPRQRCTTDKGTL